jgi:hypothetical protein
MGTYFVQYTVIGQTSTTHTCLWPDAVASDFAPDQDRCTRLVIVEDTIPPEITLVGPTSIALEGGQDFIDPGATGTDLVDGSLTYSGQECNLNFTGGKVTIEGQPGVICRLLRGGVFNPVTQKIEFDSTRVANLTVEYYARDRVGNIRIPPVSRLVTVSDTKPPLINRCGPRRVALHQANTKFINQFCGVKRESNPCLELQTFRLSRAQAQADCSNAQCFWDAEFDICVIDSHPCLTMTETQCGSDSRCQWCQRGATAYDIVDKDMTNELIINR